MQFVSDVATSLGLDVSGWFLDEAVDVSAGGRVIVGAGGNGTGPRGWILELHEPWPLAQVSIALLAIFLVRSARPRWLAAQRRRV